MNLVQLSDSLTEDQWIEIGRGIYTANETLQWAAGDWWAYGMDRQFQSAKAAAEKFGWKAKTLQEYASVSKAYPASSRLEGLSYSHHHSVVGLPMEERQSLLHRAQAEGLSVADTRRLAKGLPTAAEQKALPSPREVEEEAGPSAGVQDRSSTVEEDAHTFLLHAQNAFQAAYVSMTRPEFRLTIPVGHALADALAKADHARNQVLELLMDEVGAVIALPDYA